MIQQQSALLIIVEYYLKRSNKMQPRYQISLSLTQEEYDRLKKLREHFTVGHRDVYLKGIELLEHEELSKQ